MELPQSVIARSRTALLVSALIPLVVIVGTAIGFFAGAGYMLPITVAMVIVLRSCASALSGGFEPDQRALRSNVVAAARLYLEFHARRGLISPRWAITVVWGLWAVPALAWVALAMASVVDLATSALPASP